MSERSVWFDSMLGAAVPESPMRSYPGRLRAAAACAGAYTVLALLSLFLSRQPGSIATVWYANAFAVAFLLFTPRADRLLMWSAVSVGNVAANLLWHPDIGLALSFLPANLAEMMLAVHLLRRAGLAESDLRSPSAVVSLLWRGSLLPQLVGASAGALTLQWHGTAGTADAWLMWFEGSVVGSTSMLVLAFLVTRHPWASLRRALLDWRVTALLPMAVGFALLVLPLASYPFIYLSLPLLLSAMLVDLVAVGLLTLVTSVTIATALALGWFAPPPVDANWKQAFVYLAWAAALLPAQLMASAVVAMRDSRRHLERRTRELEIANERLEQFVRIASHDLREPLNTITQFGGLLEQDFGATMPNDGRAYLRLVRRATERMRRLLDDVLRYARWRGDLREPARSVALGPLVDEVRESLAGRIAERSAEVAIGDLPVVHGHPALLSLMLQNLIANALKFVPPERSPRVRVTGEVRPGATVITVADNGVGIDPADFGRLFRPFQRLQPQRLYEGTGLGLALCREIAEAHGGRIEIDSVPGQGTRFHVHLPRPE